MTHTIIKTPGGEELVLLPKAEFEAMRDALEKAAHDRAMAAVAAGTMETLTPDEIAAALEEATPLAFWRKKRGMTQKELAGASGVSQPYIAALEKKERRGDPHLFLKLALALNVRMEDLVAEEH